MVNGGGGVGMSCSNSERQESPVGINDSGCGYRRKCDGNEKLAGFNDDRGGIQMHSQDKTRQECSI